MRVGDGAGAGSAGGLRDGRFGDALRRAARAAAAHGTHRVEGTAAVRAPARKVASPQREGAERRAIIVDDPGPAARPQVAPPPPASVGTEPHAPPELRAVARALPLAVETFGVGDGAPLALSFGRSLEVELRAVPGGVELLLRADPRLARACVAELPDLVAALGRRGIAVVRTEVRGRPAGRLEGSAGRRQGLPFVDLPVPLR